jgi:hypothetical protein
MKKYHLGSLLNLNIQHYVNMLLTNFQKKKIGLIIKYFFNKQATLKNTQFKPMFLFWVNFYQLNIFLEMLKISVI